MIVNVKYDDKWYHDGRKHTTLSFKKPFDRHRHRRYARKTNDTWRKWTRVNKVTESFSTTQATRFEETLPSQDSQKTTEVPAEYQTIPTSRPSTTMRWQ